jgi:gas vesicle protein
MGRKRSLVVGGVIGAAVGVVLAPRHGESRREALGRLRLAARPGRDAVAAFGGTPCAAEARAYARESADSPPGADVRAPATQGGDSDGR